VGQGIGAEKIGEPPREICILLKEIYKSPREIHKPSEEIGISLDDLCISPKEIGVFADDLGSARLNFRRRRAPSPERLSVICHA